MTTDKLKEAQEKGFNPGAEFYSVFYPDRKNIQVGKPFWNHKYIWVEATTSLGPMRCVIYDSMSNVWARFEAPVKIQKKVAEFKSELQFRKGDYVKANNGKEFVGTIIKYPSNKEITIETNGEMIIVNKDQIISIISKAK